MSTSCKWCEKLLTPYLDSRLDADERAEVESHLASCESCRSMHALLSGAAAVLAAEGPAEPSPDLAARAARAALDAAEREAAKPTFVERWIRVAWPAAAAASVATVLLLVFGLGKSELNGQATTAGDPVALIAQSENGSSDMMLSVLALEEE